MITESSQSQDKKTAWLQYGRRLYDAGLAIIVEADKMTVESKLQDPKVLALALLSRTLTNFNGAVMMIEAELIVEARTLTRSCFENLLWVAELADKRADFVNEMIRDEIASQQSRGKIVLSWGDKLEEGTIDEQKLKSRLDYFAEKYPKAKPIRFSALGEKSNISDSYMWFKMLSADAAHPSMASLSRYFTKEPDDVIRHSLVAPMKPKEAEDTLQFASQALLGVCVATCEICSVPKAHQALGNFFDEFLALAKREKT